jgi:hypothetical protein
MTAPTPRRLVPALMRGDECAPMASAMADELNAQSDAAAGLPAVPWALSKVYDKTIAASPHAGRVSREDVERVARGLFGRRFALKYRLQFGKAVTPPDLKLAVDRWWRDSIPDAEAAIRDLGLEIEPAQEAGE